MRPALVIVLLWCLAAVASGATSTVSYDTVTTGAGIDINQITASSHTVTCPGGNAVLMALVDLGQVSGVTNQVSTATYNGAGLTPKTNFPNPSGFGRVEVWYKLLPTLNTSANLVVNFTGNVRGVVAAMSFCGVDQVTPFGTSVTQGTTINDGMSDTITVPTNGLAVETFQMNNSSAIVVNGGTERYNVTDGGSGRAGGQTRSTTGTVGWTWVSGFEVVTHVAVPINASVAAPVTRRRVGGLWFP